MEILSLSVVLFTLSLIIITIFVFRRCSADDPYAGVNLPPGSFGWPFMGESIEFLFGKPENFVGNRMKKYSPEIFKTHILGEKTAVICGPNGNKFVFSNEEKLFTVFRPHPMQMIFRSYKNTVAAPPVEVPQVDEVKSIRTPGFFKPDSLMRHIAKMDSVTQQQLLIHWQGRDEVKVHPLSKTVTLTLACRFFMGIKNPDHIASMVNHFDDITLGMHSIILNFPGTLFYKANKAAAAVRKEIVKVIKERKVEMTAGGGEGKKDILSHMTVVTDPTGKYMSEAEIADKIMGLVVAGYSTVSTAMTFFVKYVGENPDVYNKVLSEHMEITNSKKPGELLNWEDLSKMKYSWNVMSEVMRLVPPLQGTFREALIDFTYAGYTIPKGWKVYWTVSTTNKNPKYFKDPEKFNPSRYEDGEAPAPYTNVPFGGGPRLCPGKEYARLAILTFMHNIVKKYKWDVLYPNEKILGDMMPTPEKGLPIRLHRL
ncbi:hypothetical protein U1Q18_009983 [Sarracenia purpurea var. burkii]